MEFITTLSEALRDSEAIHEDPIAEPQTPAWPIRIYESARQIAELPIEGLFWPIVFGTISFVLIVIASYLFGWTHIEAGP